MNTNNEQVLQGKLKVIEQGATTFQVIGVMFVVLGCVMVGAGGLKLLRLLGDASAGQVLTEALQTAAGAVSYFIFAWLCRLAANAFESIAGLIKEIGEIV